MDPKHLKNKMHTMYPEFLTRNLNYWKQQEKLLDAQKTLAHNLLLRKKMLETQHRNNYADEYDRIRGMLDSFLTTRLSASGKPYHQMEVKGKDRDSLQKSLTKLTKFKGARKSMAPNL